MGFGLNPGIPGAGDTELATEAKQDAIISAINATRGQYAVIADDITTGGVVYVGYAEIGSATSSAVWRIKRIDTSNYPITTWADGNASFDNVYDNRVSLTYL